MNGIVLNVNARNVDDAFSQDVMFFNREIRKYAACSETCYE